MDEDGYFEMWSWGTRDDKGWIKHRPTLWGKTNTLRRHTQKLLDYARDYVRTSRFADHFIIRRPTDGVIIAMSKGAPPFMP